MSAALVLLVAVGLALVVWAAFDEPAVRSTVSAVPAVAVFAVAAPQASTPRLPSSQIALIHSGRHLAGVTK